MRDRTPGSCLGQPASGRPWRWFSARPAGVLIFAGAVLAGCGSSSGQGTAPGGGGSSNPSQATGPAGSTATTTHRTGHRPELEWVDRVARRGGGWRLGRREQ